MTPGTCKRHCGEKNFKFAAIITTICLCFNVIPSEKFYPDEKCYLKCPGDKHQFCGGRSAMSVYRTVKIKPSDLKPVYSSLFMGCYETRHHSVLPKYSSRSDMSIETCRKYCGNQGEKYAGLTKGFVCSCGSNYDKFGLWYTSKACQEGCHGSNDKFCGTSFSMAVYKSA
eukprot:XP_014767511.1 PREDICTED: putative fungistatic metabolite [Octopus bimaculoides]